MIIWSLRMAESRFILFENWLAGIQMNTKWGQMDSWQSELIPGISRWMLSKPTEGVFGECCTNDTDGDIDLRRLLCVHAGAWVAEIVVKAFLLAGRNCQPGFQKANGTYSAWLASNDPSLVRVQMKYFICVSDFCGYWMSHWNHV